MSKFKAFFLQTPEVYVILVALLAGFTPPFQFNPLFLGFAGVFVLQLILKYRISGIILASLVLALNLFLIGALISEYNEFRTFTDDAMQLLLGGLFIWCANFLFGGLMLRKYLRQPSVYKRSGIDKSLS